MKLSDDEFEELVARGLSAIPAEFVAKLDNVAIVIEDEPSAEQREKLRLRRGWTLFGLYQGIAQSRRGSGYSGVLPDKITIFKRPIEQAASDQADLAEIVRNTVWHEIAHHFGMDETQVRAAEHRRQARI